MFRGAYGYNAKIACTMVTGADADHACGQFALQPWKRMLLIARVSGKQIRQPIVVKQGCCLIVIRYSLFRFVAAGGKLGLGSIPATRT